MRSHRLLILILAVVCIFSIGFARKRAESSLAHPVESVTAFSSRESQHLTIEVELAGTRARIASLDQQIKQYKDQMQAKLKTDPVCTELQKVIDPLQKSADRKHSSPESYSPPDIERADMELASQRAHLLERQEQFGDDAPLLNQLRHDRITLATELAELEAQARTIESWRSDLRPTFADAR